MTTDRLAAAIGTFFGAGLFPWAPGTVGSIAMVAIYLAFRPILAGWWLIGLAAVLYAPAVWAAGVCERIYKKTDPGCVVIDEVIGQAITLAVIPASPAGLGGWKMWLAGLIIFRGFDIAKPFPIRRLERLPGGYGIITDDVLAGVYGAGILYLALRWGLR
jgi:phosphatidylglycerophosphatase A